MKICIFGSSSEALPSVYYDETYRLGEIIAGSGHGIVFGGGNHGVMGSVVRGVNSQNGYSLGIAPKFFMVEDDILFKGCTDFMLTETMAERKKLMEIESDAFCVCPGGTGTFEEFFEVYTLIELQQIHKPLVIYNVNHYFDKLFDMLKAANDEHFLRTPYEIYKVFDDPIKLVKYLEEAIKDNNNIPIRKSLHTRG